MKRNNHQHRGFILLEVLIGVMIFSVGVLALGKCVNNCLAAQIITAEDQRARLALENRMAEIEGGEVTVELAEKVEKLTGMFKGMQISQKRTPAKLKDENDRLLENIYVIDLEVKWTSNMEPQSKSLSFYDYQTR